MKGKILLMIIDMQNDFCKPAGALYVRGATEDTGRLANFIKTYSGRIDHIILTQDYHNVIDISHPVFWEDQFGNPPPVFARIDSGSIHAGIWRPRFYKEDAIEYIRKLEEQGEFPHTIWPEHCIIGSSGSAIVDEILEPVRSWARKGNFYDLVVKGTNPLTEHFGALMANVPLDDSPETQLNKELVGTLLNFETIIVAGEARSHCVANTVKQLLNIEDLARKLIILEDCMSDVAGFETIALPIWEKAEKNGVSFIKSTDLYR